MTLLLFRTDADTERNLFSAALCRAVDGVCKDRAVVASDGIRFKERRKIMRSHIAIMSCLALVFWAEVGRAADVGDAVPEFTCQDDQGQLWDSRDHVGKRPVVIYFYPSDFAFCCTRQALRYRDSQDELAKQSVEVIGVSGDAVEAHRLFKATNDLKCTLLADTEGQVARLFGVPLRNGGQAMAAGEHGQRTAIPRKFTSARWTFIIGTDGRILHRETGASPMTDSQVVLEFLRKQNAE
jgi:peroxiredoxin Q/BCP